ncbi:unnamed protein product, partial [Urochloa humidicola]
DRYRALREEDAETDPSGGTVHPRGRALSPIADGRNAGGCGASRNRPAGLPLLRLGSPVHCSAARLNRRFLGCSISKIRLASLVFCFGL